MFDSAALDVAIALVLMFFVLALLSSSIVEAIVGLLKVRSKNLEAGIKRLVSDPSIIQETSVYKALAGRSKDGAKTKAPSYMSAKAFADAVVEGITELKSSVTTADDLAAKLPRDLKARLDTLSHEVGTDLTRIKAGLESWFDDTMDRVAGIYKRWAQIVLFIVALVITIGLNASATNVTARLWNQPSVRDAVVQSARGTTSSQQKTSPDLDKIATTVKDLPSLSLPIGWSHWDSGAGAFGTVAGWLITALLVMLGAPFWYGLLTQLVSLRSSGNKPPPATADPASATMTANASAASPTSLSAVLDDASFGEYASPLPNP